MFERDVLQTKHDFSTGQMKSRSGEFRGLILRRENPRRGTWRTHLSPDHPFLRLDSYLVGCQIVDTASDTFNRIIYAPKGA